LRTAGAYLVNGADALAAGDLNHDGKPDVAVANPMLACATLFMGLGDGTLGPPKNYLGGDGTDIRIADVTGDGIPDLLSTGFNMRVLVGNGNGTFQSAQKYSHTGAPAALADFNLDGGIDLVTPIANSAVTIILHAPGT